jgi:hypothetical protein
VSTFFTLYGTEYLKVDEAVAAGKLTYFSLSMVVFAIPAGLSARKSVKRRRSCSASGC